MARLYDINQEAAPREITHSLAQSLKHGLLAPTEKKFNTLETGIITLMQVIELETGKLALEVNEKYIYLEKEYAQIKKMFRFCLALSFTSLAGIILTLVFLYNWSSLT